MKENEQIKMDLSEDDLQSQLIQSVIRTEAMVEALAKLIIKTSSGISGEVLKGQSPETHYEVLMDTFSKDVVNLMRERLSAMRINFSWGEVFEDNR